jgi:aspartate carbamoyltransferase catalytic subunit
MRGLDASTIHALLDLSAGFKDISRRRIKKVPTLRGRTVLNAFFEASTRTRVSFELAGKRMSADTVNISASGSSLSKGESLLDTAQTLDAMRPDVVVIRHGSSGAPHYLAKHTSASIVNAGDGWHEHPTQALLDLKTIADHFGQFDELEVAIIGDIAHSRVARSNLIALKTVGAHVRACGPKTLLPTGLAEAFDCTVCTTPEEALEGAHVVMALRLQTERMEAGLLPELREYAARYGMDARRLALTRPDAILMHPGPVNRGIEVAPEVIYGDRSVILQQVENGVAIRCAVLYWLCGGS